MTPLPPRSQLIDILRGIVISIMVFGHFDYVYPALVARFLDYTEFAMEGFLFLAGFSVARRYWPAIQANPGLAVKKLEMKAAKIYAVQAVMIFTLSIPMYYLVSDAIRARESVVVFTLKSLALINQIGLIHVLPTFIPMFLISPVLLYGFKKNLDPLVWAGSILLFTIGQFHPYLLDLGDRTVFPFILWQIYFVAGCYLGVRTDSLPYRILTDPRCVWGATLFCAVMVALRFSKIPAAALVPKFPLNVFGLLYGASFLCMVYAWIRHLSPILSRFFLFSRVLPVLGRHSLFIFIVHVYTAKWIGAAAAFIPDRTFILVLVLLSFSTIGAAVSLIERRGRIRVSRPEGAASPGRQPVSLRSPSAR